MEEISMTINNGTDGTMKDGINDPNMGRENRLNKEVDLLW